MGWEITIVRVKTLVKRGNLLYHCFHEPHFYFLPHSHAVVNLSHGAAQPSAFRSCAAHSMHLRTAPHLSLTECFSIALHCAQLSTTTPHCAQTPPFPLPPCVPPPLPPPSMELPFNTDANSPCLQNTVVRLHV